MVSSVQKRPVKIHLFIISFLCLLLFPYLVSISQDIYDADFQRLYTKMDFFKNVNKSNFKKTGQALQQALKKKKGEPLDAFANLAYGVLLTYTNDFKKARKYTSNAVKILGKFDNDKIYAIKVLVDTFNLKFNIYNLTNYEQPYLKKVDIVEGEAFISNIALFFHDLGNFYYKIKDHENFLCITDNFIVMRHLFYNKYEDVRTVYKDFQNWYLEIFGKPLQIKEN